MAKTKQVPIEDASTQQLYEALVNNFGVDIDPTAPRAQMLAKLDTVSKAKTIPVGLEDEPAPKRAAPKRAAPKATKAQQTAERVTLEDGTVLPEGMRLVRDTDKFTIQLHDERGPNVKKEDEMPVFIGVNGVSLLLHRGKRSEISYPYFHALCNSTEAIPIRDKDDQVIGYNKTPRFTYTLLKQPDPQEVYVPELKSQYEGVF